MPPVRSCLIARDEAILGHDNQDDIRFSKGKKRVWFADDKGLALTHVQIVTKGSPCPPQWTDRFFSEIVKRIEPQVTQAIINWKVTFPQPVSEQDEFQNKLERQCVSLENVTIKDDKLSGTIKVKNITYRKNVYIRVTFDRWMSHEDLPAYYVRNRLQNLVSPFDTFYFSVSIPDSAEKFEVVEFCVCYRCEGAEMWDNNGGTNYRIVAVRRKYKDPSWIQKFPVERISEVSRWNHLIKKDPYL
ncbi:protein phosphatase 1 regulatory subunit 3B-like [Tachypleus tridentatus]|uniref:protein phosphatase 1 regulatory subunit 3B-like n=1 Tax=Tachypleus tridentatus TaxID=6853 RepID=UPI003FD3581D